MNVDDIEIYSPSVVVNFQHSNRSVVSAKILAPLERGATTGPSHMADDSLVVQYLKKPAKWRCKPLRLAKPLRWHHTAAQKLLLKVKYSLQKKRHTEPVARVA